MKCTLNPAVAQMSGKCGSLLFKTYTKPDGKTETRVYILPKKGTSPDGKKAYYGYTRTSKISENEKLARSRFAKATQFFKKLPKEEYMRYYRQWRADKFKFNGKEYATLRGYIIARLYAANVV